MVNFECKDFYDVYDLVKLVKVLRGENGCPWDMEQTHESIRRNFIEEVYEAVEAIDEKSEEHLCEELGDVLLQVIFHADIEEGAGGFDLNAVADMECKKLIYRHPHIFSDVTVSGTDEVLDNWDELKKKEKSQETLADSLNSVAKSLPALWRAEKLQKRAEKASAEKCTAKAASDKLKAACEGFCMDMTPEAIGEVLFAAANAARVISADPEEELHGACERFIAERSE